LVNAHREGEAVVRLGGGSRRGVASRRGLRRQLGNLDHPPVHLLSVQL